MRLRTKVQDPMGKEWNYSKGKLRCLDFFTYIKSGWVQTPSRKAGPTQLQADLPFRKTADCVYLSRAVNVENSILAP